MTTLTWLYDKIITNVENIFFVDMMTTLAWLPDIIITNVENNDFVES
jgi:hypothetical protein